MGYFHQYICSNCRKIHSLYHSEDTCQSCGHFLLAEYDLYKARREIDPREWTRGSEMWKYQALLPKTSPSPLSLQEGNTPLIELEKSASRLQIKQLLIKNEAQNPGESGRDREMSLLFTHLARQKRSLVLADGINGLAISASMYSTRAQVAALIFIPQEAPDRLAEACELYGATVKRISWNQKNRRTVKESIPTDQTTLYDLNEHGFTYRIEGAKTLFFELFETMSPLPDIIFVPTTEGITALGVWKAMSELQKLGWLSAHLPKLCLVQSKSSPWYVQGGTSEAVTAAAQGSNWLDFRNHLSPVSGYVLKLALNQKWPLISIDDETIQETIKKIALEEGLLLSPGGAAAVAAISTVAPRNEARNALRCVVINPSSGIRCFQQLRRSWNEPEQE